LATRPPLRSIPWPSEDGRTPWTTSFFKTESELLLFCQLQRVARSLDAHRSMAIMANPWTWVPSLHWVRPDIVVVTNGRAAVIENDGGSHRGKASSDRSRDRHLEDAGFWYVDRFDVDEPYDPAMCRANLERLINRLR
jgi:hypothetical protein